jgi:hypothetical protein
VLGSAAWLPYASLWRWEANMADELSANDVATALSAPIMAAMGAAISW